MEEEIIVTLDELISEVNVKKKTCSKEELKEFELLQKKIKNYYMASDKNKKLNLINELQSLIKNDIREKGVNSDEDSWVNNYIAQMLLSMEGSDLPKEVEENKSEPRYYLDVKKEELDNAPLYMDYLKSKIDECIVPYIELRKLDKIAIVGVIGFMTLFIISSFVNNIFILSGASFFMGSILYVVSKYTKYFYQMKTLSSQEKSYPLGEILYAYGIPFGKITQHDFMFSYCIKKDAAIISREIAKKLKNK